MCQSSSAAHSRPFEISHSRKTVEFFHPKAAIIHAHSAKPILNQDNQTNLTRYVSLSRVSSYPIRSPTATLYQKKPTRVLRFWKTLEVRSSRSPIITSSSFCRINLLSSTNLFRAKLRQVRQVRVFSRSVCSRGLRECGGAGVRESVGVVNNRLLASFSFLFLPDVSSKYNKRELLHSCSNHREI